MQVLVSLWSCCGVSTETHSHRCSDSHFSMKRNSRVYLSVSLNLSTSVSAVSTHLLVFVVTSQFSQVKLPLTPPPPCLLCSSFRTSCCWWPCSCTARRCCGDFPLRRSCSLTSASSWRSWTGPTTAPSLWPNGWRPQQGSSPPTGTAVLFYLRASWGRRDPAASVISFK